MTLSSPTITSKIQKLSDILLETKCRDLRSHNSKIFSKHDVYHLPSSQRKVTIIESCTRVKKYPFCERYHARQELKGLYKELSDGPERDNVKDLLSKTGIFNGLKKSMSPSFS